MLSRATPNQLWNDYELVQSQASLTQFALALNGQILVLNEQRQIIWASEAFCQSWELGQTQDYLGRRFGEALGCCHVPQGRDGCGTSEACSVCGAFRTLIDSRKQNKRVVGECRLTIQRGNSSAALDLEVSSAPWQLEERSFLVVSIQDISHEKRRKTLERIFFHDVVNSAGGLHGALQILTEMVDLNNSDSRDLLTLSHRSSGDLLDEILAFRQLKMAESGSLVRNSEPLDAASLVRDVSDKMRVHSVGHQKTITVIVPSDSLPLVSDKLLLQRVLVNMLKNALEAIHSGQAVTISVESVKGGVRFAVHNPGSIPHDVQLQIFQRSFSTKSPDRGLGTYSMKLLGESVLGGRVTFISGPEGTEFTLWLPLEPPEESA
ncbi:MAG: HAMP domain-containing histidine kinase [Spirochaetales bacterium]|nr:HAMP domain-containing histidine kinase [Spirochaetales bacterium]